MTERKRATGFALMDAAFAADAKFVRLARKATSPVEFAAAVGVFWLVLADARRAKSPDLAWEEYDEYAPQVELLQSCRLLSKTGFDPETFEKWAPAYRTVTGVRTGTQGYAGAEHRTPSTVTSVQLDSVQNGEGGPGEGPKTFLRFPPKREPGMMADQYRHEGQHPNCEVCAAIGAKP